MGNGECGTVGVRMVILNKFLDVPRRLFFLIAEPRLETFQNAVYASYGCDFR